MRQLLKKQMNLDIFSKDIGPGTVLIIGLKIIQRKNLIKMAK